MERPLAGCSILMVEDEPLAVLDVVQGLERAGARVSVVASVGAALERVEDPWLTAVVVDQRLDGSTAQLREALKERKIPFVFHTGYGNAGVGQKGSVEKPITPQLIVTMVIKLAQSRPKPASTRP